MAATLHIDGALSAAGGLGGRDDFNYNGGANRECCNNGGPGSVGRIRLDYDTVSGSGGTVTPATGYVSTYLQAPPPFTANINCGNPCLNQTIDLENIGLAVGDVYTVRLRSTNAARVVGKGPVSPPPGLASDVP